MDEMMTAELYFGLDGPDTAAQLFTFLWRRRIRTMRQVPVAFPETTCAKSVPVYANHGRWIVDCPFCGSAQMACERDHRFRCAECLNGHVSMRWVPVAWPEERAKVEHILLARPPKNRNWHPGETPEQLQQENSAHGLVSTTHMD